jgi:Caenorhabditis protein of unknown function, DUF268
MTRKSQSNAHPQHGRPSLFKWILCNLAVAAPFILSNVRNLDTNTRSTLVNTTADTSTAAARLRASPPLFVPLATDAIVDPWKKSLFQQLDRVRQKCGPLCTINDLQAYSTRGRHVPGNAYSTFEIPVDCQSLFEMEEIDAGDTSVPYPIPPEIQHYYSMGGAIHVQNYKRFEDVYLGGKALVNVWKKEDIERDIKLLEQGQLTGTYTASETSTIRRQIEQHGGLHGKKVLVVGSARPWLETVALQQGAASVTTLEYGAIQSEHPQISTMTPDVFRKKYLAGERFGFDAVLSYSSLEHSGLGRYGDALNPWGDILSLARCWCVAKDDALLLMGVPVGKDVVQFNAHRIYGNVRMPLLTANWAPTDGTQTYEPPNLGMGAMFQKAHFFRKIQPSKDAL